MYWSERPASLRSLVGALFYVLGLRGVEVVMGGGLMIEIVMSLK